LAVKNHAGICEEKREKLGAILAEGHNQGFSFYITGGVLGEGYRVFTLVVYVVAEVTSEIVRFEKVFNFGKFFKVVGQDTVRAVEGEVSVHGSKVKGG